MQKLLSENSWDFDLIQPLLPKSLDPNLHLFLELCCLPLFTLSLKSTSNCLFFVKLVGVFLLKFYSPLFFRNQLWNNKVRNKTELFTFITDNKEKVESMSKIHKTLQYWVIDHCGGLSKFKYLDKMNFEGMAKPLLSPIFGQWVIKLPIEIAIDNIHEK